MVTMMRRYPTIVELEGIFDIFLIAPRTKRDPRVLSLQLALPFLIWCDM